MPNYKKLDSIPDYFSTLSTLCRKFKEFENININGLMVKNGAMIAKISMRLMHVDIVNVVVKNLALLI